MVYPLVMTNIAIENGPVEIVDLPIHSMVISIVICIPEGICSGDRKIWLWIVDQDLQALKTSAYHVPLQGHCSRPSSGDG